MKIYASFKSFGYFLLFAMFLVFLSSFIFLGKQILIIKITSFIFVAIGVLAFQLQKYSLIKNLSSKMAVSKPSYGFIYNNKVISDIFESFLIIGRNKIVVCTANHPMSFKLNNFIGKESYLKQFENTEDLSIQISKKSSEMIIKSSTNFEIIKNIPQLQKSINAFNELGYKVEMIE